ncbi:MmgE/PrpD family protein [Methanobrevibacter sp. DSM 116169]|uniref:MmgE/PrpD family protein n=1 Tax=Methanobrevibacter sp. DSM 116169 TaxID=3242727 RepID=UPI0038FD1E3B
MILEEISDFIYNFHYDEKDIKTVQIAKAAFLDFFGVTLRGYEEDATKIALKTVIDLFSTNKNLNSSVIGNDKLKLPILNTAFVNGISAHNLELDDGHRIAQMHLGAIVFPTAIAISEENNINGKDFLESIIVGYKVGIFLGALINPQHRNNGFHTTGTIGTFAASAVASKLLKLDKEKILNGFGLAGTQSAGLLESGHSGSMGKSLNVGKAVYNGMLGTYLSKNGFTGSKSIFTGENGFLNSYVFKDKKLNEKHISKSLKAVNMNGIYFKKYPFCRHIHSAIDTALKLRINICEEYEAIDKVLVKTYYIAAEHDNYNPKNKLELKNSLPYAVAIALVCGEITLSLIDNLIEKGLFEEESTSKDVNDINTLVKKIKIIPDEDLNNLFPNKRPCNIIIKLDERFRGGLFQNTTMIPKGDKENPLSLEDLIEKFKTLNPKYNLSNLSIIDDMENYDMNQVIEILNG